MFLITSVPNCRLSFAESIPPLAESLKKRLLEETSKSLPESGPEKKGLEFLIEHISIVDLINITPEDLANHIKYSYKTKDLMPWGKSIPETIFMDYVLFHKVAQEPFEPYKTILFPKIAPLIGQAKTIREAALIVNKWLGEQVFFRPSSSWDLGPLQLLGRGFGRCEELAILAVSALRSVAIPARIAWTPAWRHTDGNHAWVEVYLDDGKWHFLDATSIQGDFDRPWFIPILPYVSVVWTVSPSAKNCSRNTTPGEGFLCNETENYTKTGTINITVIDARTHSPLKVFVRLLVWNGGRLRPVIGGKTDEKGTIQFKVAQGGYILEVLSDIYDIPPNHSTEYSRNLFCIPEIRKTDIIVPFDNKPSNTFNCSLYLPQQLPPSNTLNSFPSPSFEKADNFMKSIRNLVASWKNEPDKNLSDHLAEIGPTVFNLLAFIDNLSGEESRTMKDLLIMVDPKGLALTQPHEIIRHLREALKRRKEQILTGLNYEDEIFTNFVLNPQFPDEPPYWFQERLTTLPATGDRPNLAEIIEKTLQIARSIQYIQPELLAGSFKPTDIISHHISHSRRETLIALGFFLRSNGIATLYDEVNDTLMLHNGKKWLVFNPEASSIENALFPPEHTGTLIISTVNKNESCHISNRLSYGKDFGLTKLNGLKRIFVKKPELVWDEDTCSFHISLSPGLYECSGAKKFLSSDGKTTMIEVVSKSILIKPGEKITVDFLK